MGKRQQRIEVYQASLVWSNYLGKEMNVVCANGAVYHGVLEKVEEKKILLKDLLGEKVVLSIDHIKEIILDFVTEY